MVATLAVGVLGLQKKWVLLALIVGAMHLPRSQVLDLAGVSLPPVRFLVILAVLRIYIRKESAIIRFSAVDRAVLAWGVWFVVASFFHLGGYFMPRMAEVVTGLCAYFVVRNLVQDSSEVVRAFRLFLLALGPIAIGMLYEKVSGQNVIASLFGEVKTAALRQGHFRAQGPYANAILAGTNGAVCLGMVAYFWKAQQKRLALFGLAICASIVVASGASGPVVSAASLCGALVLWDYRRHLGAIKGFAVMGIVALAAVMNDPVYYIVARIDIGGGSTGWYRAMLMETAVNHLSEWWMVGTDHTIHWVPAGTSGTTEHADITNHFIQMGVWGGLGLMVLFIFVIARSFKAISARLGQATQWPLEQRYLIWALGCTLFCHTFTFFSVSYFDPTTSFLLYFLLACIGGIADWRGPHAGGRNEGKSTLMRSPEAALCHG